MVEFHYSEEDQAEQLKKWWKQNGGSIIFGVALGLAIVGGYNYWQFHKRTQAEAASKLFETMMIDHSGGESKRAEAAGKKIVEEYKGTPYAAKAALYMARISFEAKDLAAAESHLRWALENSDDAATVHTARLRLARLLLDSGKKTEAAKLVTVSDYGGFKSEYKELEGDLAMLDNDPTKARLAYQQALDAVSRDSGYRPMLKIKLDSAIALEKS